MPRRPFGPFVRVRCRPISTPSMLVQHSTTTSRGPHRSRNRRSPGRDGGATVRPPSLKMTSPVSYASSVALLASFRKRRSQRFENRGIYDRCFQSDGMPSPPMTARRDPRQLRLAARERVGEARRKVRRAGDGANALRGGSWVVDEFKRISFQRDWSSVIRTRPARLVLSRDLTDCWCWTGVWPSGTPPLAYLLRGRDKDILSLNGVRDVALV